MQGKFVWYELLVDDVSAAARFYGAVIGWTARDAGMGDDGGYQVLEMPGNPRGIGGMMAMPPELKAMNVPANWTGYVFVDDVDASAEKCVSLGGAIRRPAEDIPGVGRFAVLADPQGAVTIAFRPAPMGDVPPPLPFGAPGTIGWHELYTPDVAAALAYYGALYGWEKIDEMDMGPMGKYVLFGQNGQMIGGMMRPEPAMPACWGYYFTVETLDAAMDRVRQNGGTILNGPMQVPDGWVAQASDPQGAYFCLSAPVR